MVKGWESRLGAIVGPGDATGEHRSHPVMEADVAAGLLELARLRECLSEAADVLELAQQWQGAVELGHEDHEVLKGEFLDALAKHYY